MDGATYMKQRLDFAKVYVTIPLEFEFPSFIKLKIREKHVVIDVEYPWRPHSCSVCCFFGHSTTKCPSSPAPIRAPRSNNADVQNKAPAARVSRASNVQNAPATVWIPRARIVGVQNLTSSVPDPQVVLPSLRASGSPSAFTRDRSNALRPSSSFSGRGKEVRVFSAAQVQQAPTNQDDIILIEEELYNFQVEFNTYAALALDEDGIEDDIFENQEDPFDDQCALKGWPRLSTTDLQKLVEVTKASLEDIQRLLQASPLDIHLCNLERIRKAELCNFMLMEEYDLLQKSNTD
ncbi:hypothetical protein IFM89_011115 [Coptis chinensis]|uniref:Zinc knuckle CX2CX4HX4C domain-containing protein n=1 Tax=Coptis chinensis TaxID=261450 RepID=A0A835LDY0_9MAGN|nr:hypothetical protein IFM89_011115 [Coptis chinensis]